MAGRKVHGSLDSPGTLKVIACLYEHDLEFEFVPVDLKDGENKRKPFLDLNPFGQIPVYEGDLKLFESRAIIRSMAHGHSKRRLGQELISWEVNKQAIIAIWIDVEDHQFEPPALKLITELVSKPKKGLVPDEAVVAENEAKLAKVLDIYEARLAKLKYLAYDNYSIADLLHLPSLQLLVGTKVNKMFVSRPVCTLGAWISLLGQHGRKLLGCRIKSNSVNCCIGIPIGI